jgi:hypothetical protein
MTAKGETIEFVSSSGSSPPSELPGDRVEVLYDPDDPYDTCSRLVHSPG